MAAKKAKAKAKPAAAATKKSGRARVALTDSYMREALTGLVDDLSKHTGFSLKEKARAALLGDGAAVRLPGVVSTSVPGLDEAIGRGGVPMGRVTVITGKEGGGKTTLLLAILASVQKLAKGRGLAMLLERENKLDETAVRAAGVKGELVFSKPAYLEKGFEAMERIIDMVKRIRQETGELLPCVIGVDSLDGFDTKAELEDQKKWERENYAPVPRVMSRCLPRLTDLAEQESVAIVFIAQERAKVNVRFGKKEDMTGGKALKFHTALILDVESIGRVRSGERVVGSRVRVDITKNQIASPFGRAEFDIIFGHGIDTFGNLAEYAEHLGVITRLPDKKTRTLYYHFDGVKLGLTTRRVGELLRKKPELYALVSEAVAKVEPLAREARGGSPYRAGGKKAAVGAAPEGDEDEESAGDDE